jgi:hypothetical protein
MSDFPIPGPVPVPHRWWPNPIFRRYVRARLRPQALMVALLITVILAGFLYFSFRTGFRYRGQMEVADAERATLIPLLVLQALILFFLGTGNVAGGITAEADEGTLDYQRLSPLTPLTKVLGYLLGLPIREWCMFAATLPFTAWALWKGEVAASAWVPIYLGLLSSALLYHLTGLVMGTVVKNRRWAFLFSIIVIFLLYTVIPQAAKFGLVYFKYLTIWPVVDENIANLMPGEMGGMMRFAKSMEPDVRFFGLHFSEATFTLFSQSVLILTFVVMLWRRWRQSDSHLLGKAWAFGLFVWMQLMLLGNALPLIEPGLLFPSRQFNRRFLRDANWEPGVIEAVSMIALYGMVTLLLLVVLTFIITPTVERQTRGLRRGRKLGWKRIPRLSDPASSTMMVALMAVAGAVGWTIFAQQLMGSHWFAGHHLAGYTGATFALILLGAGLASQAILEGWGGQKFFLAVIFAAVLPVMAGGIIGSVGDRSLTPATWLAGVSPVSAPAYAAASLVSTDYVLPKEVARAIPRAFWFWQGVTGLTTAWLLWRLRQIRQDRHALVYGEGPEAEESRRAPAV